MMNRITLILISFFLIGPLMGQDIDELLDQYEQEPDSDVGPAFKSTRVISGHSVKQMNKGDLDYRISHRFGLLNGGFYELFGLDQSTIHFSLEYGLTDWLMLGIGRGSYEKTYDGFAKISLAKQRQGGFPLTISYVSSIEFSSLKWSNPDLDYLLTDRFAFFQQLLLARKLNDRMTVQLMPGFLHRNLVPTVDDPNSIYAIGVGGRFKLSNRLAATFEYYYLLYEGMNAASIPLYNPLSFGIDIETGGHVFQIQLTNSLGMREGGFIGNTNGSWLDGDIHPGFNISRVFTLSD